MRLTQVLYSDKCSKKKKIKSLSEYKITGHNNSGTGGRLEFLDFIQSKKISPFIKSINSVRK